MMVYVCQNTFISVDIVLERVDCSVSVSTGIEEIVDSLLVDSTKNSVGS